MNQAVALGQLFNLGYRAEAVANGRELLEALETREVDIILMDCQMPEMDGFAATVEIRRREGTARHTTIIAMTANALDGDHERCVAAGMDDYLSKPVKSEALRLMLARWSKPDGLRRHACTTAKRPLSTPETSVLDPAQLAVLRAIQEPGEADCVTEVIDLFLTEATSQVEALHQALAPGRCGRNQASGPPAAGQQRDDGGDADGGPHRPACRARIRRTRRGSCWRNSIVNSCWSGRR